MSIIQVQAHPERNVIVATGESSYWVHYNDEGNRYQARVKTKYDSALETLAAAQEAAAKLEAGVLDWSEFYPEDLRGPAIERKQASTTVAHAKGF